MEAARGRTTINGGRGGGVSVAAKLGTRSPPRKDLKALRRPSLQDPHYENYFRVLALDSHPDQFISVKVDFITFFHFCLIITVYTDYLIKSSSLKDFIPFY